MVAACARLGQAIVADRANVPDRKRCFVALVNNLVRVPRRWQKPSRFLDESSANFPRPRKLKESARCRYD